MSESAARASRRDLRRAVGTEAIGVIDTHTKLLTDDIPSRLASLSRDDVAIRTQVLALASQIAAERAWRQAIERHPWYRRLWWLLRGR